MSSTLLEQCRQAHEDIELLAREAVKVLEEEPKSTKGRMLQQHKTNYIIQSTVERSETALKLYADDDGLMKEEISSMKGIDVFKGFYDQLRDIKEYHRRFPDVNTKDTPSIAEELATHSRDVEQFFSGEEMYGKYLDLHAFYVRACNMPQFRIREEYRSFINHIDKFNGVAQAKKDTFYMEYLRDLLLYLVNFYIRSQPLVVMQEVFDDCIKDFEAKWVAGTFEGWKIEPHLRGVGVAPSESNLLIDDADLDLEKFTSAVELEGLGLDALKKALQAKGMKCGGNLQQRAQRLWQAKGKSFDEIPAKDKAKGAKTNPPKKVETSVTESSSSVAAPFIQIGVPTSVNTTAGSGLVMLGYSLGEPIGHISKMSKAARFKRAAAMEACVQKMCELLYDVLENTKRQVEKKLTLTHDELEQEMLDEDQGVADIDMDDDDDDDDIPIYNPLNLPVGWDGKPIPFWLYKLHGLGVEYKCEICGNYSYWGRRAFDRHFQEWRHAHGMRCLKIPNTKHFHDIVLIEDAINLYEKIKDKADAEVWTTKTDEEFEDSEGNVLNRRTYEDLQKQGIL